MTPTGRFAALLGVAALAATAAAGPLRAASDTPETNYMLFCSGCHLPDGTGSKGAGILPFQNIVGKHLRHPQGRLYLANVPGVINSGLRHEDTAKLLNYILDTWGAKDRPKDAAPFTAEEVGRLRGQTVDDIIALRARIAADLRKRGIDVGRYP